MAHQRTAAQERNLKLAEERRFGRDFEEHPLATRGTAPLLHWRAQTGARRYQNEHYIFNVAGARRCPYGTRRNPRGSRICAPVTKEVLKTTDGSEMTVYKIMDNYRSALRAVRNRKVDEMIFPLLKHSAEIKWPNKYSRFLFKLLSAPYDEDGAITEAVSYTHLTLPTNREV